MLPKLLIPKPLSALIGSCAILRPKPEAQSAQLAAQLAWTLKVVSANGCSAGFPPGEWAPLAHLSEGEAKAIGQHLL